MNCNALYPVVHDLTDAESSYGCCIMTTPPGCFSLQDLVNPDFSPIPVEEFVIHETPKRSNIFRGRQRSEHPAYKAHSPARSLVDDRNDSSENDQRKVLFSETYVLTRQVNKGRLSNVWECVHRTTGVRYAAKIMDRRKLSARDDDLVYLEVSTLSQIRGGAFSLSKLKDFYDEETHFYIIMDFADGGDLLTTLVQRQKLPEHEAEKLAKSLLQGLIYLHKNKICHRNLKPENLLLKNKQDLSTIVIADFGMAARLVTDADGDVLNLIDRCGTATFMAPEVISQIPYDTQVDMWSVGVIMYYALSGIYPFEDSSRQMLYHKICKNDYSFHPIDWLGISKTAKRFISNLLHTDPDVRMTAEEALGHPWLAAHIPPVVVLPKASSAAEMPLDTPKGRKSGKAASGRKFKGVWRAMTKRKSDGPGEAEHIDDSKSISSQTVSVLSSDVASDLGHRRRGPK